jgi:RimJ/RimL family protein N-acetyltransferase
MEVPPYRIETERLVLRCWHPADAPLLQEAVTESLDDLRPWMPWARDEPQSVEQRIDLLRSFRGQFDAGQDFVYGIFSPSGDAVLGGTGLHTRVGEDAFEIGYWIRSSAAGRGLATEASAALTQAAFRHSAVDRVEIHVEPGNVGSLRVPEKLGFTREASLRRRLPPVTPGEPPRDVVIFTMLREDVSGSPAAGVAIRAFDAANRPLAGSRED